MAWSFRSGVSLSVQIVDRLRTDILSGKYERGSAFPTVRQLAAEAAVNPNTMQKALMLLESEGLIVTRGTAGRLVTDDPVVIERARRLECDKFVASVIREARSAGLCRDAFIEEIKKGWTDDEK